MLMLKFNINYNFDFIRYRYGRDIFVILKRLMTYHYFVFFVCFISHSFWPLFNCVLKFNMSNVFYRYKINRYILISVFNTTFFATCI